jgi:hypothetical protein
MLYEGFMEEGLAIVKGARDRYNGEPRDPMPRNPWNEIECGGHYARAMSSWSLLTALSGFRYDGLKGILHFSPRHSANNHKSLFTSPEAWGSVRQIQSGETRRAEIAVVEGVLRVREVNVGLRLPDEGIEVAENRSLGLKVSIGGRFVAHGGSLSQNEDAAIKLSEDALIRAGQTMVVSLEPLRPPGSTRL